MKDKVISYKSLGVYEAIALIQPRIGDRFWRWRNDGTTRDYPEYVFKNIEALRKYTAAWWRRF